ncbi:MAG: helix-turn-helix transcriptional regulator [Thermomicrobiales bacterium]
MNRTDRLLAVVLELQARGWVRAEDLAGGFETSVRTIYRDMQALSESGVPLVATPGRGYSLIEGYFLPRSCSRRRRRRCSSSARG